jgi:hypothetical protein
MQPAPSRPLQEKRELALPRSNTDPQHSEQLKAGYRDWDQRYSWTKVQPVADYAVHVRYLLVPGKVLVLVCGITDLTLGVRDCSVHPARRHHL